MRERLTHASEPVTPAASAFLSDGYTAPRSSPRMSTELLRPTTTPFLSTMTTSEIESEPSSGEEAAASRILLAVVVAASARALASAALKGSRTLGSDPRPASQRSSTRPSSWS